MRICYKCRRPEDHSLDERCKFKVELRPYGPGGQLICFECMKSAEELQQTCIGNFSKSLDKAGKRTGVSMLTPEGPVPYIGGISND